MPPRLISLIRESLRPAAATTTPEGDTTLAGDVFLLRWAALSIVTLLCATILQATGLLNTLHDWQIMLLCGHPFYLSAEGAQSSFLTPGGTFGLCVGLTLYLSAVLLLQRRLQRRSHICVLSTTAIILPGMICVLWESVFYVAQPLICIIILWCLLVPAAAILRRLFS